MDISIRNRGIEDLYPDLKQIGFDGVDFGFPGWNRREKILAEDFESTILQTYRRIADAGLKVSQVHLTYYPGHLPPLGNGTYADFEDYMLPILLKEIALTAKMNCHLAAIHLYFEESLEKSREGNLQLIQKLLPTLEEHGVILAIENIFGLGFGDVHLSTAEDLLFYVDHFKSDCVGACLDTGHAVTRKQNPVEAVLKLGSALKALHVHSNMPGHDLHLPPCMIRNVDWQRFYAALLEVDYRGAFNMEISPPANISPKAALGFFTLVHGIAESLMLSETKS
ncbi:MAG: sugar phosphate isomerase/epimerase [Clostridia bacterium]|nr:sugar phosphate isomerase/epimerase [Clostridia bacterium]